MEKSQYAILRFAKYKGPEISNIEAHNERTKEKYASNPDVDLTKSSQNIHLIKPTGKYRAEAERQISAAECKTRKDSVRLVEALVTASPEFFKIRKSSEVKEYFEYALKFIEKYQSPETIISAVVHMDEKTPHMHLSFVPLTQDNRLSAKEIIGNKKKLTWWQDEFWKYMVKKYQDLERGDSASQTGREHIPPRLFKQAVHLNRQRDVILKTLREITPFNAGKKSAEIAEIIEKYISGSEDNKVPYSYFNCTNYRQLGKVNGSCTAHYIRYDTLYSYVLSRLQYWVEQANISGDKLLKRLLKSGDSERDRALKKQTAELAKAEKRRAEVDKLFAKMYEDRAAERITEYNFNMLSQRYQTEQQELIAKIDNLKAELSADRENADGAERWICLIKQYSHPTELTAELLNALIEKIVIHEATKGSDGTREHEIEIFYRFVGKID